MPRTDVSTPGVHSESSAGAAEGDTPVRTAEHEGPPGSSAVSPARPWWSRPAYRATAAVVAWGLLIVAARLWGQHLIDDLGREALRLSAPPIVGWDDLRLGVRVVVPVAVALAVIVGAPRAVRALPWRTLLAAAAIAAAVWAVALAFTDGLDGITDPTTLPGDEYLLDVDRVGSPGDFLSGFTDDIDSYVTHVRSHPPGTLLTLWSLDEVGLGGRAWAAVLFIAGGALAVPAVLVAVREVAGEQRARAAAPFLVLAPVAVWIATSADALIAGVSAAAVAAVIVGTGRSGRRSDIASASGGLLFGAALMLSYGVALVALVPTGVAAARRRPRPLFVATAGALLVLGVFWLAGFSYLDGWSTSRAEYYESVASTRPYGYFLWANIAALGLVVGPATAAGLACLGDRKLWLLVGGALAAVAVADLSGFSKGEVERIWLPFAVWLLPAASALIGRVPRAAVLRGWLAAQAVVALAVQTGIRTRW